jgi:hypothetical protein
MVGWSDAEQSSSNGKKRRFEVGSSRGEAFKRRAVDLDEVIDYV